MVKSMGTGHHRLLVMVSKQCFMSNNNLRYTVSISILYGYKLYIIYIYIDSMWYHVWFKDGVCVFISPAKARWGRYSTLDSRHGSPWLLLPKCWATKKSKHPRLAVGQCHQPLQPSRPRIAWFYLVTYITVQSCLSPELGLSTLYEWSSHIFFSNNSTLHIWRDPWRWKSLWWLRDSSYLFGRRATRTVSKTRRLGVNLEGLTQDHYCHLQISTIVDVNI